MAVFHRGGSAAYYGKVRGTTVRARRLFQLVQARLCVPFPKWRLRRSPPSDRCKGPPNSLPGIGPYTAAAVASIAHGEAVACVDGNIPQGDGAAKLANATTHKFELEVQEWADQSLWTKQTLAIGIKRLMELGATVCTPQKRH